MSKANMDLVYYFEIWNELKFISHLVRSRGSSSFQFIHFSFVLDAGLGIESISHISESKFSLFIFTAERFSGSTLKLSRFYDSYLMNNE